MAKKPKEQISVSFDPDTLAELRRLCGEYDMSISTAVRIYVLAGLRKDLAKEAERDGDKRAGA